MADKQKVLLIMLPFWTPLVPPQGICHLKNYLRHHGYDVTAKDANIEVGLKEIYDRYFDIIKELVPEEKHGNFYNVGHDVMRNHMLAHIHYDDQQEYLELVKIIIYQTFYTEFSARDLLRLKDVLDLFYTRLERYMCSLLESEKPDVLGISVLRDTIGPSLFAFRLTRERYPGITNVMGGCVFSDHLYVDSPNFGYFLERTPYIDKIIVGEGQGLFLELLEGNLAPSQRVFTLGDIDRKTLGYSELNQPDMSDFNVQAEYPYMSAAGSTSCPNRCSFCNVAEFYGDYREKAPQQTVIEMIQRYEQYGNQLFYMNDSLLNGVATGISQELLKSGKALYWDGYMRCDRSVCDIETTMLWRRGGLYRVRLGVESGSQRVLDLMDKGITIAQTREALSSLANAGIKTTAYWVIGHPGETEEDFLQTLDLLEELKNNIYEAECNPFIFGYTGQAHSDHWSDKRKLLYPEWADKLLILRSWTLETEPTRETAYRRMNRFVAHCKKLGIPNPYSLQDIYQADKRWLSLHENAVPGLVDFKSQGAYIDECKHVKAVSLLQSKIQDSGDFGF